MDKFLWNVALLSFFLSGCATTAEPPTSYPDIDLDATAAAVAVVRVRPGKYLPELEGCTKPNVICLHSSFWFNAKVVESVYGNLPSDRLKITTLSHYGMDTYENAKAPWLISLAIDNSNVVMPLYAAEELVKRKDGALFLLIEYPLEPAWLPCSVAMLREELLAQDFPKSILVPSDAYEVRTNSELYRVTPEGAFPRYGINVSRLHEHLDQIKPTTSAMRCEQASG